MSCAASARTTTRTFISSQETCAHRPAGQACAHQQSVDLATNDIHYAPNRRCRISALTIREDHHRGDLPANNMNAISRHRKCGTLWRVALHHLAARSEWVQFTLELPYVETGPGSYGYLSNR
jgi:hypothetical protein